MVVFTCGHCGESVQKPKVEKHYLTKCRNRTPNLSCMDCFKDFLGNDYDAHNKCITEAERYSGKGFVAKENKGEKKQNIWVEMLQSVLDEQKGAPGNVRRIIETVSKHNNTPRKKPKFINFVKNVCGARTNSQDIEQAWNFISVKLTELSAANAQSRNKKEDINKSDIDKEHDDNSEEKQDTEKENGNMETVDNEEIEEEQQSDEKKSKKERKAEKKKQKYAAELQKAAQPLDAEDVEETQPTKKGKKKKNRSESISNGDAEEALVDDDNKKKRKRQDTINGAVEVKETTENSEMEVATGKVIQKKKKAKGNEEEADESVCLHDQNVAKIGDLDIRKDKFDWHAVILSVLEKKGNEVPFKRLQKKVLGEYAEATGQEIDDRIADKFIKKLRSAPNVRVGKNRVLLLD